MQLNNFILVLMNISLKIKLHFLQLHWIAIGEKNEILSYNRSYHSLPSARILIPYQRSFIFPSTAISLQKKSPRLCPSVLLTRCSNGLCCLFLDWTFH